MKLTNNFTMINLALISLISVFSVSSGVELQDVFEWKQVPFAWKNEEQKQNFIDTNEYIERNNLPLGVGRWNDKLFVTVPRWKKGVAATLNYINLNTKEKSPTLIPYPSWEANTLPTKPGQEKDQHLISVFRVFVDKCDRLWAIDLGIDDILGEAIVFSTPALMVYDLKTDKLVKRYEFKPTDVKQDSFFANVVVDVTEETCDNAFAYVPDLGAYGVVVYSLKDDDSWRVKHNYFICDPLQGDYNIGGVNFQWTDGIFSLSLSKIGENGYRTVYFHAFSSTKEFSVSSEILQNKSLALNLLSFHSYKLEGEKGENTQSSASYLDENSGVLFLTQENKNGIACWNTKKPLNPENFALFVSDDEKLIFPNDITIDHEDTLWILSDKMPKFIYQELDDNDTNYRIMKTVISEAIKGTVCE